MDRSVGDRDAVASVVEETFRREAPRLHASAARLLRDLDAAEEAVQDACVRALETWPRTGVPRNPGAWLQAAARNRALDELRSRRVRREGLDPLARRAAERAGEAPTPEEAADAAAVPDGELRLLFTCCHPVLPREMQVALTLRLLGGLTTGAIARAHLVPEATIAQRIVRAKRALREAGVALDAPPAEAIPARLPSVLEAIYLVFSEGHAAGEGEALVREDLCADALRLGALAAALLPGEPEALGLLALMELQASRLGARAAADGSPVLLEDQDRALWDRDRIARGIALLERAQSLGRPGPYQVQAALAACHAEAASFAATDWRQIAALYGALGRMAPSPVVELNRAVAVGFAEGFERGLAILDGIERGGRLRGFHRLPAARAGLLARAGRRAEAAAAYAGAAALAPNPREREWLEGRAAALATGPASSS
jgi:RNA polymerase sigma factor (sigma-70 family)